MLKLQGITKTYETGGEKVEALKGIDIEFRNSEFVSILGQSGCGKTTLLKRTISSTWVPRAATAADRSCVKARQRKSPNARRVILRNTLRQN